MSPGNMIRIAHYISDSYIDGYDSMVREEELPEITYIDGPADAVFKGHIICRIAGVIERVIKNVTG